MAQQYNTKCAGVKRLMKEAVELREPTEMYYAQPTEESLFEWHFTVRGTIGSDFEGGIYHGRIILPQDYPMKPPNMIILTPNGRFELNKKICLSISGFHPETWLPSWSIRTALLALIGFMPTAGAGALGSLDYPAVERRRLAKLSRHWKCPVCDCEMKDVLLEMKDDGTTNKDIEEANNLAKQLNFASKANEETDNEKNKDQEQSKKEDVVEQTSEQSSSTEVENVPIEQAELTEAEQQPTISPTPTPPTPVQNTPESFSLSSRFSRESFNYSSFFMFPLAVVCISIFIMLLSRRLFVPEGTP